MICNDCKSQRHGMCPGQTWCDCQHRTEAITIIADETFYEEDEPVDDVVSVFEDLPKYVTEKP